MRAFPLLLCAAAISILSTLAGIVLVTSGAWGKVLDQAGIHSSLYLKSSGTFNVRGTHLRLVGDDGNLELEHAAATPVERLNAYVLGTPKRTPIAVGYPDGQDLVELIVRASGKRSSDLQQWRSGGRIVSAIDAQGDLRLGTLTLSLAQRAGKVVLVATLPSGERRVLASG